MELKLDPVDAARVVLFCMGNSGALGTSFEVRGRSDEAVAEESATAVAAATLLLPDLMAPLLPDSELHIPSQFEDDETVPSEQQLAEGRAGDVSRQQQLLVRVAPWCKIVGAEKVVYPLIGSDGSDSSGGGRGGGQRTRHPLAREREWEPFICYTVRMQLVLPMAAAQRAAATPADDDAGENVNVDVVGDGTNASRGEDGAARKSEGGMEAAEPEAGGNEAEAEAEGSTAGSLVPLPLSPRSSSSEPEEAEVAVEEEADASHGVTNTNPDSSSGNGTGGTGGTGSSSKDEFDLKPSGELQEWFVRFRFTDFLRLQEALEEDIARRQELYVQSVLARQERQRQEEKEDRAESASAPAPTVLGQNGSVESTVEVQADAEKQEQEKKKEEEEEEGFRLRVDSELVDELRALLPPARWLKTEHAVVLERRTSLQAYLDTALQAKRLPPPATITAITADSTDQGHQASPDDSSPVVSTGAVADGSGSGSGGGGGGSTTSSTIYSGRCSDEIVQRWVSAAFLRCAVSSGAINHSF
eukprot:COSAG06_NODE_1732_length_8553_cov_3.445470_2_plen_529_part_00